MDRKTTRTRGITWIEMLIAMFMVGVTTAGFAQLLTAAARAQTVAITTQSTSSMVQHKLDQLRALGYGRLTYSELQNAGVIDSAPTQPPYSFTQVDDLASVHAGCQGRIDVQDFSPNVRRVQVQITWTTDNGSRQDGSELFDALIAR